MLDYILRFIVTLLLIAGVAFLIPALMIFFLQVLIIVGLFWCVLHILKFFVHRRYYKGEKDESVHTE